MVWYGMVWYAYRCFLLVRRSSVIYSRPVPGFRPSTEVIAALHARPDHGRHTQPPQEEGAEVDVAPRPVEELHDNARRGKGMGRWTTTAVNRGTVQ